MLALCETCAKESVPEVKRASTRPKARRCSGNSPKLTLPRTRLCVELSSWLKIAHWLIIHRRCGRAWTVVRLWHTNFAFIAGIAGASRTSIVVRVLDAVVSTNGAAKWAEWHPSVSTARQAKYNQSNQSKLFHHCFPVIFSTTANVAVDPMKLTPQQMMCKRNMMKNRNIFTFAARRVSKVW